MISTGFGKVLLVLGLGFVSAAKLERELVASCDAELEDQSLSGLFETDPVTVVSRTDDTVTFTVSQTWADDKLCLITTHFETVQDTHTCPMSANVGPGLFAEYTAKCDDDGYAYVDVFVYDPSITNSNHPEIPAICEQTFLQNTDQYSFKIPCDPTSCPDPTPVVCEDFPTVTYGFDDDAELDDWLFGTTMPTGTGMMTLNADVIETSKVFQSPANASNVNFEFTMTALTPLTADQLVYIRAGPYYLDVTDSLTSVAVQTSGTTYYGGVLVMLFRMDENTWMFAANIPDELLESGSINLGIRSVGGGDVGIDNVLVSVDCFDFTSGPGAGGGGGDPHFNTWNSEHQSFHGECDLVMVHSDKFHMGTGLDLHVRTTIESYFSYIETAALRIGEHVVEFHKNHFFIDGDEYKPSDLPMTFGTGALQYTISNAEVEEGKNSRFYQYYKVDLHENSSILFKYYKKYLTIDVSGHVADFHDSVGLLGDFHTGNMVSREGQIMNNFNEFGFEWQVQPEEDGKLFREDKGPQLPFEQCRMPTAARPARRHLRGGDQALHEAAMKACAHVSGNGFDLCVDDVLSVGDLGLATLW